MMRILKKKKKIALIAHDLRKDDLLEWCRDHQTKLSHHELMATGTTGKILEKNLGLKVKKFQSGPLGGDQQIGALIAQKKVDMLIFFWDPLISMPHDPDIKAILRLATLWNIPVACNESTADFLISSVHFSRNYEASLKHIELYHSGRS
jgi:methylglyoxal synthase